VTSSVLSDGTIRRLVDEGRIKIDPWDPGMVQPASVDVRLGTSFRVFHNHRIKAVDLGAPPSGLTELLEVEDDGDFVIHPTEFVLGRTTETVELPDDVVARIEGKSSLGRLGLVIHSTAGFVDPGFEGNLTLELSNQATLPITLYEGMPIGQISFMRMDGPVESPYGAREAGSKYQGQAEPTPSRFYLNFEGERNGGRARGRAGSRG
jgi:dCTP deaminase